MTLYFLFAGIRRTGAFGYKNSPDILATAQSEQSRPIYYIANLSLIVVLLRCCAGDRSISGVPK